MTPTLSSSLADWLAYIEALHTKQIDMGLERIRAVNQRLETRFNCPVITVGGTNGKGSVCAMLEAILIEAGYRVGMYTSPHIHNFNERARVNGKEAAGASLVQQFAAVEEAREKTSLTYFEFTTLAIMHLFAEADLDVVILEVGLGGRLDAVNLLDADVAVVTNVAIDHADYLGDDRETIGYEKACIFRTYRSAICGDMNPPKSLLAYAQEIGADLRLAGRDFQANAHGNLWDYQGKETHWHALTRPAMQGANQLNNAAIALAALEALQLPISEEAVSAGLEKTLVPGRFQVFEGVPALVLDVAHNPHAATVLAGNLKAMGSYVRTWAVFGAMQDKDLGGIITVMKDCIDVWCVTDLPVPRAMSAVEISARLNEAGIVGEQGVGAHVKTFNQPQQAYAYAAEKAGENDRIVAFGSFWVVAGIETPKAGLSRH